jgi:hypothetical protein
MMEGGNTLFLLPYSDSCYINYYYILRRIGE